jgi:hypothetical protein
VKRARLAALIPLVFVLACSSGPAPTAAPSAPPGSGSPQPIGVCNLIPTMDEIVGKESIDLPAGYTLNDVDRCIWTYGLDPSRYLSLSIAVSSAHQAAIDAFGAGEHVAGLGADARWWPSNRTLSVSSGSDAIQVTLELEPADVSRDLAISIAQAALDGLN